MCSKQARAARRTIAACAVGATVATGAANANVQFQTGNFQLTNVNFLADHDAMTITGHVGGTGLHAYFNGFGAGPAFDPQLLHASHGDASVSAADGWGPLYRLTITADPGFGFSGMDWKLDALPPVDGLVTFAALDQFGVAIPFDGTDTFAFDHDGQNPFHAHTSGGSLISTLVITSTVPIADIKQVSVEVAPIPAPGAAALLGLGGLVASRRRR